MFQKHGFGVWQRNETKIYQYRIHVVKGLKRHQQQLTIETYYVYANRIGRKLLRNRCLNLCFQMEEKLSARTICRRLLDMG